MKKLIPATAIALGLAAFAAPVAAHEVQTAQVNLPSIPAGGSHTVNTRCSHGYALSGGYASVDEPNSGSSLVVTGSHPSSTRSWAVTFTNDTGRPTTASEASVTLYVKCGYRH